MKQNYFEKNVTSYSYLFFAAASAIAFKGYYHQFISSKLLLSSSLLLAFWRLFSPSAVIVLFLVGSLRTFQATSNKWNNFFLWFVHIFVCLFVIIYTPIA